MRTIMKPFRIIGIALFAWFWSTAASAQTSALCSDVTACNYNSAITGDVSECNYTDCAGCKEPLACNYNADATIQDNGSCAFALENTCALCSWDTLGGVNPADGTGTFLLNDADQDGLCDNTEDNCTDVDACNYDADENLACTYPVACYRDDDGDNIGDYLLGEYCPGEFPAASTTNLFNGTALDLCADLRACNYNDSANTECDTDVDDDGICTLDDLCEEKNVPNFDAQVYGNVACCDDENRNGVCDDAELFGCMDSNACNYLAPANVDDGSCKFAGTTNSQSSDSTAEYQLNNPDNLCDACIPNDSIVTISEALRDAMGLLSTTFAIGGYTANDADGDKICDANEQVGCDDPAACNYRFDTSGNLYPQAQDVYGNPATNEDGDPLYVTESCHFDEALLMGVRPNGEACDNYCRFNDVCGECGGTGTDVDLDGVCDNTDNCTDILACNYNATANEACKYLTQCDVCAAGNDTDGDGYIDDDTSDADGDGLCDTDGTDNCFDLAACNYADEANVACLVEDACAVCGGSGVDVDGDGLCDDVDACTDVTKCNYDITLYPGNLGCFEDGDGDGVCNPFEVAGCQDEAACNYNAAATDNLPAICTYVSEACEVCSGDMHNGTDRVLLADLDGDGICDDSDLCSDATACNYDANPTEACKIDEDGNGTCDEEEVLGCTNPRACNFNSSATKNNNTCVFPVGCQTCSGESDGTGTVVNNDADFDGVCDSQDNCSDTDACNYIAAAASGGAGPALNATCVYPDAGFNCAGDCLVDADNDGICDGVDVCFDLKACNFADPANVLCLYRNTCGDCVASAPGELGYDPDVYCDCDLNVPDLLGNCGGGCEADVDGDGICDNVDPCLIPGQAPDACGVCAGPGAIYECGCFELPETGCSCETNGRVTYPDPGADCDGNCLYGTMVVDGVTMCKFFDEAEITVVTTPVLRATGGGEAFAQTDPVLLEDWLIKFDSLHARMSSNLDDGTLTGASERVTIEQRILDKGKLDVLGTSRLSGYTQMDSDVVILGNLVIEQDLTVRGTTFSLGGIETTSMDMSGNLSVGGAAVIDSTLEVLQPVLLHDSLTVDGRVVTGNNRAFSVDLAGNTQINGEVVVLDSIIATQNGTQLADLVAGNTTVTDLEATGGADFRQNLRTSVNATFNRRTTIAGSTTIGGTLDVSNQSNFTALSTSTVDNTGLLSSDSTIVTGGVDSPELSVTGQSTTGTLDVASTSTIGGSVTMRRPNGNLVFSAAPTPDSTQVVTSLVGDLRLYTTQADLDASNPISRATSQGDVSVPYGIVAGSFGSSNENSLSTLSGDLTVQDLATFRGPLTADADGNRAFEVTQEGVVNLNRVTTFDNTFTMTSGTLESTGSLTYTGTMSVSDLTVSTSTTFDSAIDAQSGNFSGDVTTPSTLKAASGLVAGSTASDVPSGFVGIIDGGPSGRNVENGLVIRVNHTGAQPDENNVYLAFRNKNDATIGQILGVNSDSWDDDAMEKLGRDEHIVGVTRATAESVWKMIELASSTKELSGQFAGSLSHLIPDSWCCSLLLPIGCIIIPIPGFPLPDWADLAPAAGLVALRTKDVADAKRAYVWAVARMIESSVFMDQWNAANEDEWESGGVAYTSGNGDYAEYLPILHDRDTLRERQIVGVRNGHLTFETDNVDHLVVVSTAPIVAGKLPPSDDFRSQPVAFMGQVPVDILGRVEAGDFILPSGDWDGFGIAVSPEDLRLEDLDQILGIAWQSGTDKHFNTVNVAVGLATTAEDLMFDRFDEELDEMAAEIQRLKEWALWQNEVAATQATGAPMAALPPAPASPTPPATRDENATASTPSTFSSTPIPATIAAPDPAFTGPSATVPMNELHPMLAAAEQQQQAQHAYNENFVGFLGEILGPALSLADLRGLASSYEQQMSMPTPLIESTSNAFVQKMMRLAFTDDALKLMVREHVLGNPDFPLFAKVQPGTKAEAELLSKMETTIQQQLSEQGF